MVNSVKGSRKIKKTETSDLLLTCTAGKVVSVELNFIEMVSKSVFNKSFCSLDR